MIRQKSKFWTLLFSLVPGCGHLFMGFRRRGLSLLLVFAGLIAVTGMLHLEGITVASAFIVWFYAFFDALNLNNAPPEEFVKQTDSLSEFTGDTTNSLLSAVKFRKYVGYALLIIGVVAAWDMIVPTYIRTLYTPETMGTYNLMWQINNMIPRVLVAIAAVVIGLRLIIGKKKQLAAETEEEAIS